MKDSIDFEYDTSRLKCCPWDNFKGAVLIHTHIDICEVCWLGVWICVWCIVIEGWRIIMIFASTFMSVILIEKKCACVHWAFFKFPPDVLFHMSQDLFFEHLSKRNRWNLIQTLQNVKMWVLFVLMLFFWKHVLKGKVNLLI